MELNKIQLPPFTLAELYRNALIIPTTADNAQQKPVPPTRKKENEGDRSPFLGNNAKNILILVNNPGISWMGENELQFLTGILSACKLSLDDVALVNIAGSPTSTYRELVKTHKARQVFLMGTEPSAIGLPMNFPPFQIQPFAGTQYLYTPGLADMENDKLLKSKLWVTLRKLFNL